MALALKNKPTERDAVDLRMKLNSTARYFYYDTAVLQSVEGIFKYISHDLKLVRFAQGSVGVVSDCYILYAIAILGSATVETICLFLKVLSKKEKDLAIPDLSNKDSVVRRLEVLVSSGFVYRTNYTSVTSVNSDKPRGSVVVLYSSTDDGIGLVNQRLSKRIVLNQWFQAKPLYVHIGWAAASYVGVIVADHAGAHFCDFQQGLYRTKALGTIMLPPVVKIELKKKSEPGYVCFVPAFLHRNAASQRKEDFEESCFLFANTITQYLYYCDMKGRIGRVCVVVENNDDLVNAAYWLHRAGALKDNSDRIYFTGESVLREARSLKDKFLSVIEDEEAEGGFIIVPASPEFVWLSQK